MILPNSYRVYNLWWRKQEDTRFTCPMPDEEPKDVICFHYHDYEKFYNAMIEGRIAVHFD